MIKTNAGKLTFFLAATVAGFGLPSAQTEKKLIDKVVAVVEDDAIFQSDIEQTLKQFLVQKGKPGFSPGERATLERQALDELVNARLVLAKARRLGIDVSFDEVEKAVDQAIDENRKTLGGDAPFQKQLDAEGLSVDDLRRLYREQLRNRMLVDRVLASEISRGSLRITDRDLLEAYKARKDELPMRPAVVHLHTVYLSLESSANAKAVAKKRIEELHRRIVAGEDFAKVAEEHSEDPSAQRGGSLGSLKLTDLSDKKFAETAGALAVGEVSPPVQTGYGFHVIQVTGADSTTQEVSVRHILIRIKPGDDDIQTVFAKANKIHGMLVGGAAFDSTAILYSDDEATASKGGDLGWLRVQDLPEFFQDVLESMNPGDISQVLREPNGFRIVKLVEREAERPFEFAEVKDDVRKIVEQEKMATAYDTYLATLRDEFYVEIRN